MELSNILTILGWCVVISFIIHLFYIAHKGKSSGPVPIKPEIKGPPKTSDDKPVYSIQIRESDTAGRTVACVLRHDNESDDPELIEECNNMREANEILLKLKKIDGRGG